MRCPECGGTLVSREIVGVTIDECGGCLGIWFDAGELETYRESLMPKKAGRPLSGEFMETRGEEHFWRRPIEAAQGRKAFWGV